MTPTEAAGRALGGGALHGDRLVKFVYLDEAGIGSLRKEPHVVVAGVVVHADHEWRAVEGYLRHLADKYALKEKRGSFVFHATDIFHGVGDFPREKYDRECRNIILDELSDVFDKFQLPVVASAVDRAALAERFPDVDSERIKQASLLLASIHTTFAVECAMRHFAEEGEVALLVYENNDQYRKRIRGAQNYISNPENFADFSEGRLVPLNRIVDTAHFAEKTDTSILQIADLCAFVIRRRLAGLPGTDRFYEKIKSHIAFPNRLIVPAEYFRFSPKDLRWMG